MLEHFKNLQSIGLNKNQAKVYLASLELGPATVIDLSKRTSLPRATIYDNLRVLKNHGLITEVIDDNNRRLLMPENPEKLFKALEDKKQKIKDSLPGLLDLFNSGKTNPKIQFFQGKKGIIKLIEMCNQENPEKENLLLGDLRAEFSWLSRQERLPYKKQRIKKAIRSYIIATNTFKELKKFSHNDPQKHKRELRQIRLAPENLHIPFLLYIFHNKVAIVPTSKEGYTIIFESPELSQGLKSLFKFLWSLSTPFVLNN